MKYYTSTTKGLEIKEFDIKHTVESAQPLTFHADYNAGKGTLNYVSNGAFIKTRYRGNSKKCQVELDSENSTSARRDFVRRFRLKDNMKDIYSHIAVDGFMKDAVLNYRGMRVTLNDPWETTMCFIISQYNNVKRIRLIIKRFIDEFGSPILDESNAIVAKGFPKSEDLTRFSEKDFRRCGAGFRAKYITKAAEYCTNSIDLYKLRSKGYDKLKGELMEISGVGDKVADCIALMGYGKMEAFPIDVWVKRTMERVYFKGKDKGIPYLHGFAEEKFGNYKGYAQQYIFWHGRNL